MFQIPWDSLRFVSEIFSCTDEVIMHGLSCCNRFQTYMDGKLIQYRMLSSLMLLCINNSLMFQSSLKQVCSEDKEI
jgi:hypothetical protein